MGKIDWIIHLCCNGAECAECGDVENGFLPYLCNAHTHGMEKYHHMDFQMVLNLPPQEIGRILNTFGLMVQSGCRFHDGEYVLGIYEDCSVRLMEFTECGRKVLRIVLPDSHNIYPESLDCEAPYSYQHDKHCPLLNGNKCSVHAVKPVVCAMFPIGRVLQGSADGPKPEEITSDSVQYIFVKPGCGDDSETHTVREWFEEFGIPMEDEFFVNWQRTLSAVSSAIRRFEKGLSPETMNTIWNVVFGLIYLNYDTEQDFTEQFSDNAAKVMKLISMAEGTKGQS